MAKAAFEEVAMCGRFKRKSDKQKVARVFEEGIAAHPADWHMLQRVFVADLDPERLAAADAAGERDGEHP